MNFADNFYLPLNRILLTLGYPSKIFGPNLDTRIEGLRVSMNRYSVLETILCWVAMAAGIINEPVFESIVEHNYLRSYA